jgi:preprotein translocase subunit SecG
MKFSLGSMKTSDATLRHMIEEVLAIFFFFSLIYLFLNKKGKKRKHLKEEEGK